jgi:hypothetical protein
MKKLIIIVVLALLLLQGSLFSQTNPANPTINKEYSGFVNLTSSYKDVKITKIISIDSLNTNSTDFYVTLNKGLNWQIKPKNYLRLYSPVFVKSAISGTTRISGIKKIGHIIVINSDPEVSEGKLEFDEGIDMKNDFNQNLSYARKKVVSHTIYFIPKISLWSKKFINEVSWNEDIQTRSGIGLGYSIYNTWGGGYAEFSLLKTVLYENYSVTNPPRINSEYSPFVSAGFLKMAGPKTGLRMGASYGFYSSNFLADLGILTIFNNSFSLINGLSFSVLSPNGFGVEDILYAFGIGYSF